MSWTDERVELLKKMWGEGQSASQIAKELGGVTRKWPIGDPATEDFWFCGLSVQAGKPYCEAHVGVAFQPMSARRDRRR